MEALLLEGEKRLDYPRKVLHDPRKVLHEEVGVVAVDLGPPAQRLQAAVIPLIEVERPASRQQHPRGNRADHVTQSLLRDRRAG